MIVSFINQKGGVGKTTLSINVSSCLADQKHTVLLIDADKQGSASAWASLRDTNNVQVIALARENMAKDILKLADAFDYTIIDSPPHAEGIARSCIIASDLVLIPIEPSGLSTWASDITAKQIENAREFKENLKCGFVVSRKISKTILGKSIHEMAKNIDIPLLETEIEQRIAFAESITMGQHIFEWAPQGKAAQEIIALTKEIKNYA